MPADDRDGGPRHELIINLRPKFKARRLVRPQQKLSPHHQGAALANYPLLADQPPAQPASPCH